MELIRIDRSEISGAAVQTVNARDLHTFLGVRKDFSDWIKAQIARAHLVEGEDYIAFPQKGEQEYQGVKTRIDYAVTLEAGKHIAMMAGTPKGRQVRSYFIECERRLQQESAVTVLPGIITDDDKKVLFGTMTKIVRREFDGAVHKLQNAITEQNRHLWRAMTKPRNAINLQGAGFIEIGGIYRLAGLGLSGIPGQHKLSANISRSMDAFCKRHGILAKSAVIGSREVTHWPEDAAVAWLSEQGHEMIRQHIAQVQKGKVAQLRAV